MCVASAGLVYWVTQFFLLGTKARILGLTPCLLKKNGCLILSDDFLHLPKWSYFFFFQFKMVNFTDSFSDIMLIMHSWDKPHLVMDDDDDDLFYC